MTAEWGENPIKFKLDHYQKVEHFLTYSRLCGRLEAGTAAASLSHKEEKEKNDD